MVPKLFVFSKIFGFCIFTACIVNRKMPVYALVKILMFSTHSMKYIWYSPQKSKYPLYSFIELRIITKTNAKDLIMLRSQIENVATVVDVRGSLKATRQYNVNSKTILIIAARCRNRQASWENKQSAYAKTKTQISSAVTAKLISAFVFATRIVHFLYFLNPKFQASSLLL